MLRSKNIMLGRDCKISQTTRHLCESFVMWGTEFIKESHTIADIDFFLIFPTRESYKRFLHGDCEKQYKELERIVGVMNKTPFIDKYDDLHFYLGQTVSSLEMTLEYLQGVEEWLDINESFLEGDDGERYRKDLKEAWDTLNDFLDME
jgi:hypothetical protein